MKFKKKSQSNIFIHRHFIYYFVFYTDFKNFTTLLTSATKITLGFVVIQLIIMELVGLFSENKYCAPGDISIVTKQQCRREMR